MTPGLAHFLTLLHSRRWRARYGEEFEALLREVPATPKTLCDTAQSIVTSQHRPAIAAAAAIALLLVVSDGHRHSAAAIAQRTEARSYIGHATIREPRPCGAYSSIPRSDWMHRKECLV